MTNAGTLLVQGIDELIELINQPKTIAITTHHKPDADALGSSLALARYLTKKGHKVRVISPSDYPKFLNWMPGQENVLNFSNDKDQQLALNFLAESDLLFCLDFSSLSRINKMEEVVRNLAIDIVMIDHHLEPEDFAQYKYWNPKAAATAELIFNFISQLGDHQLIDIPTAECLYAGIVTDTGGFRHPCTTRMVHLIVADLIRIGINPTRVQKLIYDNNTASRLKFLGYILSQKMVILKEFNTAYIAISREELKEYEAETGDTEGFVNFALSIEGIVLAAVIIDRTEMVKMSFRSVGDFSVNEFARAHFEGGGHSNASGGKSSLTLDQTVDKFVQLLPMYASQLQATSVKFQETLLHS